MSFVPVSFSSFALGHCFCIKLRSPRPETLLFLSLCAFHENFHPLQKNRKRRERKQATKHIQFSWLCSVCSRLYVLPMIPWVNYCVTCLCFVLTAFAVCLLQERHCFNVRGCSSIPLSIEVYSSCIKGSRGGCCCIIYIFYLIKSERNVDEKFSSHEIPEFLQFTMIIKHYPEKRDESAFFTALFTGEG